MNPRYLAYCRAHGMSSEKMMAADEQDFPGGPMAGYMIWIGAQLHIFASVSRKRLPLLEQGYAEFDRWLATKP